MEKNEEVLKMVSKVVKKLQEEVEKKGLKMSVTENGKERARSFLRVATWRRRCVNAARKE